jgi:hypothetical protein
MRRARHVVCKDGELQFVTLSWSEISIDTYIMYNRSNMSSLLIYMDGVQICSCKSCSGRHLVAKLCNFSDKLRLAGRERERARERGEGSGEKKG